MGLSRSRRQSPECLSPSLPPPSPQPSSAFEDFFDVDSAPSRPMSEAFISGTSTPNGALGSRPPSLTEILLDVASPPWTLSAFMAYLSQNHCMESLEFTLDSQRYAAFYNEMITENQNRDQESLDRVCVLWEKLMQVYIIPCAPREVNIPARIRDQLLNLPCGPAPPHPSQLDEAGRIIYELMNDSLLVVSLPESPNQADWTNEDSEEAIGSGSSHHGHPLLGPIQADDGWNHNPDLEQDGGSRDGMAARPDTARSGGKSSLVQKNIRMRRRYPKISDPAGSLQPTDSTCTSKSQEHKSPVTYYHSGPLVASISATSLAADSDQDKMDFTSTPLSDVSNYLPTPAQSCENMAGPATMSDNRAYRYASPMEDMYGWDAELDRRKFPPSRSSMSSREGCDTFALSYRRANGSKSSLLQRVFRVGSSSSLGKYETAI
ncbi:hypothetical protein ACJZ2D_015872 [Fusarium nematophilum]